MTAPDSYTRFTTCPMDCPDTCTLDVTVEQGRITSIDASDHNDFTHRFICSKIRKAAARVYGPDRVMTPKRRIGPKGAGEFEQITWDEAIAEITDRFRLISAEYGGEAILPFNYGGSNGYMTDGFLDEEYFARLGASRIAKTVCAAPSSAAASGMYGKMPGVAFEDFVNAKCIVIWGANPKASNIHLVPLLKEARRRGAFVATVDPVKNFSDAEIDLHIPVSPGADLPLALALINRWKETGRLDNEFMESHVRNAEPLLESAGQWSIQRAAEVARVSEGDLVTLADRIADSEPCLIRAGWGIERNKNGGQAYAAVISIPALLGKFGVAGGGYAASNSGAVKLDRSFLKSAPNWNTRQFNMSRLGALFTEAADPPIKAVFVYNCNPVATMPNQNAVIAGFERDDVFTVVFDEVMTDTAVYADIVLPATTFFEEWDVRRGYGAYVAGGVVPVVDPVGESRTNPEVFAALGRAMGWDDEQFNWTREECMAAIVQGMQMSGNSPAPADFETGEPIYHDFPGERPVQFGTVFPGTADGLVDLCPEVLGHAPYAFEEVTGEEFPLALISPAKAGMTSSTFGESNYPVMKVSLNPEDADARGIARDDRVRVFNELGDVHCVAEVTASVRPGTVVIPKGAWRKSSLNGRTSNALSPDTVNVVGGGACFNDARVEVARL